MLIKCQIKEQAKKSGKLEGKKEQAVEIAKELLDILAIEIIAEKTGLTIEEVEALK